MMKFQFGKTRTAECLSETLTRAEYIRHRKNVSSVLSKYNHIINQIDFSNLDIKIKKILFKLVRQEFKYHLFEAEIIKWPIILKNLSFNVFTANYRKAMMNEYNRNDICKNFYKLK